MNKKIIPFLLAIIAIFMFAVLQNNTYAVGIADIGQITNKAKVADLKKCHTYFGDQIDINKLTKPSDILAGGKSKELALPNGTTNNDSLFSCQKLLDDYMGYSFSASDTVQKDSFLKKMGYSVDNSYGRECYTYTIKQGGGSSGAGGAPEQKVTVCANIDNSKIIGVDVYYIKGGFLTITWLNGENRMLLGIDGFEYYSDYDPNNVDSLFNGIDSVLSKQVNGLGYFYGKEYGGGMEDDPGAAEGTIYKKGPLVTNTPTVFTEDERVGLLVYYFKKYGNVVCNWSEGATEITISGNTYYAALNSDAPGTFYIVSGTSWFGTTDWSGIVNALNGLDIDGMPTCDGVEPDPITPTPIVPTPSGDVFDYEDLDTKPCFNGSGALGWILCPIIRVLYVTLNSTYDNIIVPFLEVNVSAFSMDGDNSVYGGWQTFQGFANVVFAIMLLVVIFSQVTGIGIDNLGIKRILPKLIVAAVLINLSFIICQLLVDISNIAGYSLRGLFENIPVQNGSGEVTIGQTALTTGITAAIGAMTGVAAGATASMWAPMLVIPLLLGMVGILISVVFMFIILGVRQAGVIILVVISPLAFVLYMLPNTKTLFQRWYKAFAGLLLVFPICGALIGGSALASKIIAGTSTGFWPNLLAALLTVIPFFFIPTLLKGSFSALGNLGAKLSGAGAKIGGTLGGIAKGGVERTGVFRNIQANAQDRQNLRNRKAERRRLEGVTRRIGNIADNMRTPEQRMQYAQAQAALEKMNDEDDFNMRPDLIVSEAASKRFNRRVEAIKAGNVKSGVTNRTGDVKDFNGKGSSFASDSLAGILYNAQDDAERYAAVNQLMASGHHGAEALHQVMQALGNDGNNTALQAIANAAKGDSKLGELKSGARSTYDYINDIAAGAAGGQEGSGMNIADYAAKVKFGGMSEQQLFNTDKEELQRYAQVIANKRASGEAFTPEEEKLVAQATAAWNNDRLRGGAKKDVQDLVSQIAFNEVRDGNKARQGQDFNVRDRRGGFTQVDDSGMDEAMRAMQDAQSRQNGEFGQDGGGI